MFDILRPFLFKFSPEIAHSMAIKALKFGYIPPVKLNKSSLIEISFLSKKLLSPVGIAAGFDKNAEVYNALLNLGFGFVEVGTITPNPQFGNPKPRVFRLEEDQALINRLGFNNEGSKEISSRIKKNKPKGLLGVNIGPNKDSENRINDFIECFKIFHNLADYLTINISSPNTENLRNFHGKKELGDLINAISAEKKNQNSKIPLAVKISPDLSQEQIENISEILLENNIEVAIISNSTDKNREGLNNINKMEKGGLSGKPLEKISNLIINKFYNLIGKKIKIIGVGGADSAEGVYEKILNGATLVQLYTGMVYKGPKIAYQINKELIKILEKEGIKNIGEVIGSKKSSWRDLIELLYKPFMSKKCELTGKIPLKGHNVSHANNKTKRKFLPNLKKVKFKSEILKRSLKLTVSNAGVRTVDKKGSFDEFLKSTKSKYLSLRLRKLKKSIINKIA